ncbi:MAG: hypothetical protein A2148_06295 [Chloroflexi bacterium RBG_16_68_14]|nr:MAG: hypothetical protein A2148_06295 [Chloroflexi bacterium RBG_16_68_14]
MLFEDDPTGIWLVLLVAAIVSLTAAAIFARWARQPSAMWAALALLALLLIGSATGAGLSVQPEWRSQQDTALALLAVGIPGAALVFAGLSAVARTSWPRELKLAGEAALAALAAEFATILTIAARAQWTVTEEPLPGAPAPSRPIAQLLMDIGWFASAITALAFAAIVFAAIVFTAVARARTRHA